MKQIKNAAARTAVEYALITVSIWIMVVGVYFFKFPNHFAFGGITGFSTVIEKITPWTASGFTNVMNILLLAIGFLFLGRNVRLKTVYATLVMSVSLSLLEKLCPLSHTLTTEPLLELMFAIFLPAVGSALLFQVGASSGGTDILAMILKKYTSLNIGSALLVVDITSVAMSFFVYGPSTGLFSILGLLAKSLVIDQVIESINLCKCFTIVCEHPEPICDFIIHNLHRSATVYKAQGAFSHDSKTVILVTMKRRQAISLRNYIHGAEPKAFMMISNSSEIIGKGFQSV